MVGERHNQVDIQGFLWDHTPHGNVAHIALHEVTPDDVEEVAVNDPHFYDARSGYTGHVMLGPNLAGRYLYVVIDQTFMEDVWVVVTAHWMTLRRAKRIYLKE